MHFTLRLHSLCVWAAHTHNRDLVIVYWVEKPSSHQCPSLKRGFLEKLSSAALPFSLTWEDTGQTNNSNQWPATVGIRCVVSTQGEVSGLLTPIRDRVSFTRDMNHRYLTESLLTYCRWLIMKSSPVFRENRSENTLYK